MGSCGGIARNAQGLMRRPSSRPNESVGQNLGVIGEDHVIDIGTAKPEIKGTREGNNMRIDFNLQGFFQGVRIYKAAPGAVDFHFLALDTSNPYHDTEPYQQGASYYAVYVLHDEEVGQHSNVLVV